MNIYCLYYFMPMVFNNSENSFLEISQGVKKVDITRK